MCHWFKHIRINVNILVTAHLPLAKKVAAWSTVSIYLLIYQSMWRHGTNEVPCEKCSFVKRELLQSSGKQHL